MKATIIDIILFLLFSWNLMSPTANISSTIKTSGSTIVDIENANLATIPDEKFFIGTSRNSLNSENSTISS